MPGRATVLGGLLLLAAWSVTVGAGQGGDPRPALGMIGLVLAAFLLARRLGMRLVAVVITLLPLALLPLDVGGTYPSGLPFPPLGYANASAALLVQSSLACGLLAQQAGSHLERVIWSLGTAALSAVVVSTGSIAATVLLVALLPASWLAGRVARRWFVATAAMSTTLAVAVTTWLVLRPLDASEAPIRIATTLLSWRRVLFWREAILLWEPAPVTGHGPGAWARLSPTAQVDVDAVAPHHEYLQVLLELGLVGAAFLLVVLVGAYGLLWIRAHHPAAGVSCAALTAAGIHASIDYVMHAPAVVVAVAMLWGATAWTDPVPDAEPNRSALARLATSTRRA